jgi:hypothetical protein
MVLHVESKPVDAIAKTPPTRKPALGPSLTYDPPVCTSLLGIRGEHFIGVEMEIALDGKS